MEYIESISCTDDGQLITIMTNNSILLFETTQFAFVLKIDTFPLGLVGKISNCKCLYNTRILGFIYHEKNEKKEKQKEEEEKTNDSSNPNLKRRKSTKNQIEENHTLVIIDIEYNKILGKIKIKGRIDDYELTQNFIIIKKKSLNKVLLFKTINLEYYTTLENVNLGKIRYMENIEIEDLSNPNNNNKKLTNSISIDTTSTKDNDNDSVNNNNPNKINIIKEKEEKNHYCIFAYQDFKNKREVILIEYMLDNSRNNIINHRKRNFIPNFNAVGVKFIYLLECYLLISSNIGNKLHIYDVKTFKLLHCIFLGCFPYDLSGIRLNADKTIISIITNNKYVKLYKLSQVSKKCMCLSHDDTKVTFTKKRSFWDAFKHKINSGITPFWCKFKINFEEKDQLYNDSIVIFDENNNERMWVVQKNCTLKKFNFDPNRPKIMRLDKNLKLTEFYRFDMEQEMKQ